MIVCLIWPGESLWKKAQGPGNRLSEHLWPGLQQNLRRELLRRCQCAPENGDSKDNETSSMTLCRWLGRGPIILRNLFSEGSWFWCLPLVIWRLNVLFLQDLLSITWFEVEGGEVWKGQIFFKLIQERIHNLEFSRFKLEQSLHLFEP